MDWRGFFWRLFRRLSPADVALDQCPQCGREMDLIDKTTFAGNDMRTYRCARCDGEYVVDFGMATWQALHKAQHSEGEN